MSTTVYIIPAYLSLQLIPLHDTLFFCLLEMSHSFPSLYAQVAGFHLISLILAVPSTWNNIFLNFACLPLFQSDAKPVVNILELFPENFSMIGMLLNTSSSMSCYISFTFYVVLFDTYSCRNHLFI